MQDSGDCRRWGFWWAALGAVLWLIAACAPPLAAPLRDTWPSEVATEAGVTFFVRELRLPGTRQELELRQGGAITWIPLAQIEYLRFTGPRREHYRPAIIVLTAGGRTEGEVRVDDFLLEGTTDLGYWNMPLGRVERLKMGRD